MPTGQEQDGNRSRGHSAPFLLAVLAWLWLLIAIPFLTDASCFLFVGLFLGLTWLFLAAIWLGLPVFARRSLRSRKGMSLWLFAGAAGALGLLLAFTNVGLTARVALSERWLVRYATEASPGTDESLHQPRFVGMFWVDGTVKRDGAVFLYTSSDFLNRQGIAYVPAGVRPPGRIRHLQHLYGPWYSFEWKF